MDNFENVRIGDKIIFVNDQGCPDNYLVNPGNEEVCTVRDVLKMGNTIVGFGLVGYKYDYSIHRFKTVAKQTESTDSFFV